MSAGLKKFLALMLITACAGYSVSSRADLADDLKAAAAAKAEKDAKDAKALTAAEVKKWDEAYKAEMAKLDVHQQKWDAAAKAVQAAKDARDVAKRASEAQAIAMKNSDKEFADMKKDLAGTLSNRYVPDNVKTQLRESLANAEAEAAKVRSAHAKAASELEEAARQVAGAEAAAKPIGDTLNAKNKDLQAFFQRALAPSAAAKDADAAAAKRVAEAKMVSDRKVDTDLKTLRLKIEALDLKSDLASIKNDITDRDIRRAINEEALNNSRVGEFVQAKLEGMMLQDGFCSGVKNCTQGKAERINFDSLFKSNAIDRNKAIKPGTQHGDSDSKK